MRKNVLLFLLFFIFVLNVYGQNRRVGDFELDGTVLINYYGKDKEVRIPSNLGITEIGPLAFSHNNLTSVFIPIGITAIKNNAFSGCRNLISITIPEGVARIENAFGYSGLTNINIPASVVYIAGNNDSANPGGAFSSTPNIIAINVDPGNAVYSSVNGVLYNKEGTVLIQYPQGKLDQNYVIPSSVISIENCAFIYAKNLINLTIPSSVNNTGNGSFFGCDNLNSKIKDEILNRFGSKALEFLFAG